MGQGLWDAPAQCGNTMREKVIKYSNGSGGEQEAWGGVGGVGGGMKLPKKISRW